MLPCESTPQQSVSERQAYMIKSLNEAPKSAYLHINRPSTPLARVEEKRAQKKRPCENCIVLMLKGLPSSLCGRCLPVAPAKKLY